MERQLVSQVGAEVEFRAAPDWATRRPRGIYEQRVGIQGFDHSALEARDLSAGGLRVAPHPALSVGSRLTLEIHCSDGAPPIEVDAQVVRDDGTRGAIFCFDWLDPMERERLSSFVARLNPVATASCYRESYADLDDDETPTLSVDLSSIAGSADAV